MRYDRLFSLDDRVAVVIGAASGIGKAAAQGLAAHGAIVICADLDQAGAVRTAGEIGATAKSFSVDVTETDSVAELFRKAIVDHQKIDIVITTPGANIRKPITVYEDSEFDRVIELNLKGTFRVLREAGRLMSEAGSGSIIAFSSIRSQVVEPGQGIYAATKAGIVQMVRALAAELGPKGVRVNAIAPGVVETPLTNQIKDRREWYEAYASKSVFKRWARVEEMVGPALFLASDASSYITGSVLVADGGWTAADGRFDPPL
jgi:NAD(P)-dependent dehydrogenase (short-subunit alcohol dehydrogenase family)